MNEKARKPLFTFVFFSVLTLFFVFLFRLPMYTSTNAQSTDSVKVSIIVPVYNTEKYISDCLDTLENQTLNEIEIICVNDGSTDNSLQILKDHQQKDSRVKIIDQKNGGVCSARNQGIKNAQGTYIAFVDSDDLIPSYAYEKAYNSAVKYNVNVVGLNIMTFKDGEDFDPNQFQYDESKVKRCGRQNYQNPFYYMLENSGYVVTKFFKRSFVMEHNLLFKEGVTHYEDALFNFMAFPFIEEMVQDDNIFYCYRVSRPNSAVYSFNAKKVLSSSFKVAQELIDHHDIFNFRKADEWILDKIMDVNYLNIVEKTKDPEIQKMFSAKLVELLEESYFKKYNIEISQQNQDKINTLKSIAAG